MIICGILQILTVRKHLSHKSFIIGLLHMTNVTMLEILSTPSQLQHVLYILPPTFLLLFPTNNPNFTFSPFLLPSLNLFFSLIDLFCLLMVQRKQKQKERSQFLQKVSEQLELNAPTGWTSAHVLLHINAKG